MTSSMSLRDAAWNIDPKDLRFCKDRHGNNICLGEGGFGKVTHSPWCYPFDLCTPEWQLAEVWFSCLGKDVWHCASSLLRNWTLLSHDSACAAMLQGRAVPPDG